MAEGGSDPVNIGVGHAIKETERALLVVLESDGEEHWIPKSVMHDDSEVFDDADNSEGDVVVKRWFAEREGLG